MAEVGAVRIGPERQFRPLILRKDLIFSSCEKNYITRKVALLRQTLSRVAVNRESVSQILLARNALKKFEWLWFFQETSL